MGIIKKKFFRSTLTSIFLNKMSQQPIVAVNTTTSFDFPHTPIEYTCPVCKNTAVTRVEKKLGPQFLVCLILCIVFIWSLIGLILLCCLCCNEDNFEFVHYCGSCGHHLGSRGVVTTKKYVV